MEPSLDAPKLVTAEKLTRRMEKFATFRALADAVGDPARGQALFAAKCLTCHLVSRDADAIVIRQPNTADARMESRDIAQADFTGISIMPEGLLESMSPQDVSDLFAHLKSLTAVQGR